MMFVQKHGSRVSRMEKRKTDIDKARKGPHDKEYREGQEGVKEYIGKCQVKKKEKIRE